MTVVSSREDGRRNQTLALPVVLGAAAGAILWLLSGLALWAFTSASSRWEPAIALVFPATVPVGTWQQLPPWNLIIPTLGALLFGGLLGLGYGALLLWRRRWSSPRGIALLGGWIVSVVAAYLTAAAWALGNTIANSSPTGFSWAFRSAQPDLLASGYFGVIWGWLPALIVALIATRRPAGTADATRSRPQFRSLWLITLVAFLTIAVGVGLVLVQPAAVRAARIAAGGTPDGLPTVTPTPTPTPVAAPPRVAPTPVTPGANWCMPEHTSLTATATEGAMGHRMLTLMLINRSASPCVVDGYPDIAFADAGDHALTVTVVHGGSYLASDPGATPVTLAPGTSAEAHLSWNATGARTGAAHTVWAAQYPGAQRSRLAIDADITDDSTVSATAWALQKAAG